VVPLPDEPLPELPLELVVVPPPPPQPARSRDANIKLTNRLRKNASPSGATGHRWE